MDRVYKCLACGGSEVTTTATACTCRACGTAYPVRAGVPLLMRNVSWRPSGFALGDDLGRAVCGAVGIEPAPDKVAGLREILAWNYDLPDVGLTAENNYFLERVRATLAASGAGNDEAVAAAAPRQNLQESFADCPVNEDVRAAFTAHHIPDRLPPNKKLSVNVRLTNTGRSVISSRGRNPVNVAYHWREPGGRSLAREGIRTPLLIDLRPGRSLTLPILVRTPRREGPACLELTLVHEGRRWLDELAAAVPVELRRDAAEAPPAHWRVTKTGNENYALDHVVGRDMVLAEVERRRRPGLRLLEVGGCCHPQMGTAGCELYNVDIDVQTLQVGALAAPRDVHFVAADAGDMPFVDGCFDGIVMFATLHHFVDPAAVLRGLRRLVKPDGFLAVMCEPCNHARLPHADPGYIRELEQGINEQSFSLDEYALMFGRAGLSAYDLVVHRSSLKALLRPTAEAPRRDLAPLLPADVLPPRPAGTLGRLWSWVRRAG